MKLVLKTTMIMAAIAVFAGCITTEASSSFERETIYMAKFPCITVKSEKQMEEIMREALTAMAADCERFDKKMVYNPAIQMIRCNGGAKLHIQYKCIDKNDTI